MVDTAQDVNEQQAQVDQEAGGIVDLDLSDAKPLEALPEGEYPITITGVRMGYSKKKQCKFMTVFLEVEDRPLSLDIIDNIWYPSPVDTPKQNARTLDAAKTFFTAFGIDVSAKPHIDEFKGASTQAILKQVKDDQYGDSSGNKNTVSKYLAQQ